MSEVNEKKKSGAKKTSRGGRNLIILGVLSVVIAAMTTGVSLAIYHNSGDIYLDRSRPGFLPDEEEIEEDKTEDEEEYDFAKSGKTDLAGLKEYLEKLNAVVRAIDSYEKPFGAEVLSDERLGIVEKVEPEGVNDESLEKVE
ncbi:hypothetical protein IJF93_00760 [Candidatus Saccharibacteria bacterium]|nr:hypothetical protein [Candidatus Saccharibacteria bacterium]